MRRTLRTALPDLQRLGRSGSLQGPAQVRSIHRRTRAATGRSCWAAAALLAEHHQRPQCCRCDCFERQRWRWGLAIAHAPGSVPIGPSSALSPPAFSAGDHQTSGRSGAAGLPVPAAGRWRTDQQAPGSPRCQRVGQAGGVTRCRVLGPSVLGMVARRRMVWPLGESSSDPWVPRALNDRLTQTREGSWGLGKPRAQTCDHKGSKRVKACPFRAH
jgi:hypothetical protein